MVLNTLITDNFLFHAYKSWVAPGLSLVLFDFAMFGPGSTAVQDLSMKSKPNCFDMRIVFGL